MQIIKTYNPHLVDKDARKQWVNRFGCTACGCVFEATKDEYTIEIWYGEYKPAANCPICGNYTNLLMEVEE